MRERSLEFFREFDHDKRLREKKQRVGMLKDLLSWNKRVRRPSDPYLVGLKRRIKLAEAQLQNMRQ